MAGLSTLIRKYRLLALWLIAMAMALAMKAAMPAGYMLAKQDKVLTVLICADASGAHLSKAITIPAAGKAEGGARSADTCPYASLALASLGASDAPFVALAIAFMLLLGFAPVRIPRLVGNAFILPPLRGPPALI